jgi:hypothetical protein
MAASALIVQIELRICRGAPGTTGVMVQQSMSNNPGQGQAINPIMMPGSQMLYLQDAEIVPGTDGSVTLANLNTALTAAVTAFAAASGTPLITAALLAQINAWSTGSP